MAFLPDESRSLPPPRLVNRGSVWLGFCGWVAALLDNGFNRRPILRAGVHRQILFTTVGWFAGYFLVKRSEYMYAKVDRELFEYMRQHPEDFKIGALCPGHSFCFPQCCRTEILLRSSSTAKFTSPWWLKTTLVSQEPHLPVCPCPARDQHWVFQG